MPYYTDLRPPKDTAGRDLQRFFPDLGNEARARIAAGLIRLRAQLAREVPPRRTEKNLIIGSWNIVSLGAGGFRDAEGYFYLAEVLSVFDLVAIQEVKPDLTDLGLLTRMLGPGWRYMVNDSTGGDAGNDERSAYLYNSDRVRLAGVAGELTLWDDYKGDRPDEMRSLKRPPYMTGFQTAWKDFALVNLHLHPGKKGARPDADPPKRADAAIRADELALLLAVIADRRKSMWTDKLILIGDMNFSRGVDDDNVNLLRASGFRECGGLVGKSTNITVDPADGQPYDRMFFGDADHFRIATRDDREQGGVIDFLQSVLRLDDWPLYRTEMRDKRDTAALKARMMNDDAAARKYFRDTYRKRQVSDHLPIWVELEVDDADDLLRDLSGAG